MVIMKMNSGRIRCMERALDTQFRQKFIAHDVPENKYAMWSPAHKSGSNNCVRFA